MYGYIRPLKPELRLREYDRYRAAYCGLCHALSRRAGFWARFCVTYDMVLPVLLLPEAPVLCRKRCPVSPFRKRCVFCVSDGIGRIADMTLILAGFKLQDTIRDSRGFRRLGARLGHLFMRRRLRKAAEREPAYAEAAERHLAELNALESANGSCGAEILDRSADCFASLTAAFSLLSPGESRIWQVLFYHIGRFIYLLDAIDDLADDFCSRRFNPLIARFGLTAPALSPSDCAQLSETLEGSLASAAAAFELLPARSDSSICANILYLGLPAAMRAVFARYAEGECTGCGHKKKHREVF